MVLGFELRAFTMSHSTSSFLVISFFELRSHELFAWGWLQTLLISWDYRHKPLIPSCHRL
jgi:hypothetical protein